jgi:hypothetical protein
MAEQPPRLLSPAALASQPVPGPPPAGRARSADRMDAFRRPGGFASPMSPTRHGAEGNCNDEGCGCAFDGELLPPGSAWKGRRRSPASSPRAPDTSSTGSDDAAKQRRVAHCCASFELRPYLQLVATDVEARRVALFFCSHLAVLALELLLPALWRLDPALLGAGLRGLLRSISLALVLHAMVMTTRPPTTGYSYGCARLAYTRPAIDRTFALCRTARSLCLLLLLIRFLCMGAFQVWAGRGDRRIHDGHVYFILCAVRRG